ncbi:MAG: hypothetical protein IKP71_10155, partial [Candidatus Riflebacteria bacterium]|nr:hypothetical protein [Candidatus Riflebacteria bacterium]
LFDFNRFGFYKVKRVNLSESEFDEEIFKLTSSAVNNSTIFSNLEKEIEEIDNNIKNLNEKENSEEKIKEYYNKKSELEAKKEEFEYLQANCDLTDLEETKKILSEIKSEVLSVISDYAKSNKIETVINVSLPRLNVYGKSYSEKSGRLLNLFNQSEMYSLLCDGYASDSMILTKNTSEAVLNYLSMVKDPILTEVVFDDNCPLVVYGGEKIDSFIINKIYSKYSIKESVTAKIHLYKEEVKE